jgi:hypothetical protein
VTASQLSSIDWGLIRQASKEPQSIDESCQYYIPFKKLINNSGAKHKEKS